MQQRRHKGNFWAWLAGAMLLVAGSWQIVKGTRGDVAIGVYELQEVDESVSQGQAAEASAPMDSTRFGVKKTAPVSQSDLKDKMGDLRDAENAKTEAVYDERTDSYVLGTKIGDSYLNAPFLMTKDEYERWSLRRSMQAYFNRKNQDAFEEAGKKKFDFTDMQFDLGPAEKIFGPGGVQVKMQGEAELKIGVNMKDIDNPSLPIRNRKTTAFDFDEKVNVNVQGKIGDKMDMSLNYNTEASFDYDMKNLKLKYEGKEDEIIKLVEAGNISFPSNNSLVTGASSLFGVRTDMQFGKLKMQVAVSQKKSVSKSVSASGGNQMTSFEIAGNAYEANRHFFLGHFFRDNYDRWMATLPNVMSGVTINRIEVWVTNKNNTTTNTRNIVAFADLAEQSHISNPMWHATGTANPANGSNDLYSTINNNYTDARQINQVFSTMSALGLEGGVDYEKIESAKLLSSSEYSVNTSLGYISLKTTLQTDQVLAVAYEYTYLGTTYQVGEFSTDRSDNTACLYVKSLKNAANTPMMANWDLMMKNVYNLGASSVQADKFRLDIKYLSDTTGVYLTYLPEAQYKDRTLLSMLNLDRLDNKMQPHPNGYFDFVDGYTVDRSTGRIFFPAAEPFGSYLAGVIGNEAIANKYVFQELYDSTLVRAKQVVEKDKFILTGQFKGGGSSNVISLGSVNVPRGSVMVTAGGVTLVENTDYTVNYTAGEVTIINQSIIDAGTPVNVSLESNDGEAFQRKTMLGLNWQYDFTKDFILGGTIMHLKEQSLTTKVAMGSEPLNNTIWGLNVNWKKRSQWLTDLFDKLPLLKLEQPSQINFSAEFAQLIAGKNDQSQAGSSYIDDFENTKSSINVTTPSDWVISSTPLRFSESTLTDDVRYGYNRALLSWYTIDPLFTRRSSSLTPGYIKSDLEQLSNHYVREVYRTELFPNRELTYGQSSTLDILNLAFYPDIRGPYNLNPDVDSKGRLKNPSEHWGGMMRALETTDFDAANIEYIEFWLLDPFIYSRQQGNSNLGGEFYIDLGDISEDILKDGNKAYESGMGLDASSATYNTNNWGKYATQSAVTYAFTTNSGSRAKQDVGLNGLTDEEEREHPSYAQYLNEIRSKVEPAVYDSIYTDPAGDNFHYFRGSDFDEARTSILNRYLRINNPQGNSADSETNRESYSTAYKSRPDVEDINQDYTLNEYNNYYEYRVKLHPDSMRVGAGYIVDHRAASVGLRNGNRENVDWYLFRIPLTSYIKKEGNISDFSSVRFMRMYMTDFEQPTILRFGTLELVRGEWRNYEHSLTGSTTKLPEGELDVSAISIQENNNKTPVNYVLPPGISRVVDRSNSQLTENNEQALNITVKNLPSGESRAVYKTSNMDLRQYKHIQMFVHANALTDDINLKDNEAAVFIRLGSDYRNNYYEYEIPLTLTPAGHYDTYTNADCAAVWPESNMLNIDLSKFTNLKNNRNREKSAGNASFTTPYYEYDEDAPNNKITVMGNPTLGEVRTMMIGVRNNSRGMRSAEVWVNELRLQDYADDGGWAARSKLDVQVSDFASLSLQGHVETAGFGGLEQGVNERRKDNLYEYSLTTNVQFGKFFPEKAKARIPLYYSYSKRKQMPKYNPLDTDIELDDALDACVTSAERDSLENIVTATTVNTNFSVSNARFDIATKSHPMPYDPANFSISYSHSHRHAAGETTVFENDDTWKFNLGYSYAPDWKPLEPFKNLKDKSKMKWLKLLTEQQFSLWPQSITLNSDITRTYYELQERDMDNLQDKSIPMTWSQDFLWNRSMGISWDLTGDIHLSLKTATNAEIQEPYMPVNKSLYPDEYTIWKDSVWHSIKHFGTPLNYNQSFNLSWKLPINKFPLFKWIVADMAFDSQYSWNRGTTLSDGSTLGNTINNSRNTKLNSRFQLEELYNLVPFLKNTNRYYSSTSTRKNNKTKSPNNKNTDASEEKFFEQEIQLFPDSTFTLKHNQRSRNLKVSALRQDGKRYVLRYRVLNNNSITVLSKDTAKLKVTIKKAKSSENQPWYKITRAFARFAMMVRNISVSYNNTYNMSLPGFLPNVGDFFGQRSGHGSPLAPGVDFAFGLTGESYLDKASRNGWLLMNDSVSTPATTNNSENLQFAATVEPIPNLKIDLNATRVTSKSKSIQYMYAGRPATESGSFQMTTISISTAFTSTGDANNGYNSQTFEKFLNYLDIYQQKVENKYSNALYPANTSLAGQPFDPANGTVNKYSSDVMIPAFLAAYCGGGAESSLDVFPSLKRLLPNWKITYSGLMRLSWFKSHFKSFNIEHSYKSLYAVGSYNTYSSYHSYMDDYGFITDAATGNPIPSSMYDISTVSINEAFSPLAGFSFTLKNSLSGSLKYNRTRVITLSMTSQQITEALSSDVVIGLGYKINNLKLFNANKKRKIVNRKKRTDEENDASTNSDEGSVNNSLNLRADFSLRDQTAINRNILTDLSQATSGNNAVKIALSAEYQVSRLLSLSAYYDRQTTTPLLTSSSYPTTVQDFGIGMKFSLAR
ncbi:MAG: cell surface protein SprA [Prevotellaceae bacterium]|nr:cell surface protein SprA [Prevotellaceae bacterium]